MPDDDELLGQNEVDVRNEGRRAAARGESPLAKLPIIGYDVMLIRKLAQKVYRAVEREGLSMTRLRQSSRGDYFEVKLADSRIARVTVELDRVDPDA